MAPRQTKMAAVSTSADTWIETYYNTIRRNTANICRWQLHIHKYCLRVIREHDKLFKKKVTLLTIKAIFHKSEAT